MLKQLTFFLAVLAIVAMPATTHAAYVMFTLDPSQSNVKLIGLAETTPLIAQLPGSDTASYSGTIILNVDDRLTATQLELVGGSLAVAADFASPLLPGLDATLTSPGTPAASPYGIKMAGDVLQAALRDVSLDITGPLQAVDGSGNFSSDSHTFTAVTGTFDGWQYGAGLIAHDDMSGQSFPNDVGSPVSSYVVSGNTATLSIVVNSHEPGSGFSDYYEGVLVGTALVPGPSAIPGDTDLDGDVDVTDLGTLATYYGTVAGAGWSEGDFSGEGDVNVSDLGDLATNYGYPYAVAGVPEPSTFVGVLILCLAGLLARAHRKL